MMQVSELIQLLNEIFSQDRVVGRGTRMQLLSMMQVAELLNETFSQDRVLGRGCSDKGGPGQLLEGDCEAFQSGERTEKYRN